MDSPLAIYVTSGTRACNKQHHRKKCSMRVVVDNSVGLPSMSAWEGESDKIQDIDLIRTRFSIRYNKTCLLRGKICNVEGMAEHLFENVLVRASAQRRQMFFPFAGPLLPFLLIYLCQTLRDAAQTEQKS